MSQYTHFLKYMHNIYVYICVWIHTYTVLPRLPNIFKAKNLLSANSLLKILLRIAPNGMLPIKRLEAALIAERPLNQGDKLKKVYICKSLESKRFRLP